MERRGDQRAVASGIGEPGEIVQPANTSPSQQHQPWRGIPHTRDQPKVEPRAGADTGQVYHDQRADAGVRGVRGDARRPARREFRPDYQARSKR